ncbi:unnamed protein product [Auanema sp. JU1783]|nr:unnamed protein product [Auanema sp. JU1783]
MVKVGIIGAGAAGITTAKQALSFGHDVTVYEQMNKLGGTWVYDEDLSAHSAMYEVLKTNLPREVMNYHDQEISTELPSFVGHKEMLEYLEDYAKELPILFNHKVAHVERVDDKWKLTVEHDGKKDEVFFDALFVCNGHYFSPRVTFSHEQFKGKVVHSKDYRRARDFQGQRVVVVGAGPSGIDIALQISETAKEVFLVGKTADYQGLPDNLKQFQTRIEEAIDNRVVLTQNHQIIDEIDTILACTGYEMKFSFLSNDLIETKFGGQMVSPLWNHVVHVKYPTSLFFVGISLAAITLPLFEYQARLALSFLNGTGRIPSEEELRDYENKRLEEVFERGMEGNAYHLLKDDQWQYMETLSKYGNFEHFHNLEFVKGIYYHIVNTRKNVTVYKKINFVVHDDKISFHTVPL